MLRKSHRVIDDTFYKEVQGCKKRQLAQDDTSAYTSERNEQTLEVAACFAAYVALEIAVELCTQTQGRERSSMKA